MAADGLPLLLAGPGAAAAGHGDTVQVVAPDGSVVDDTTQRPMPALLWYPPAVWQSGETVVTEKPGWYLPATWAPLVTVSVQGAPLIPWPARAATRSPGAVTPAGAAPADDGGQAVLAPDGRLRLPAWTRRDGRLAPWQAPAASKVDAAQFKAEGWQARLAAYGAPGRAAPGGALPVVLRWEAPAGVQARTGLYGLPASAECRRADGG